MDKDLKEYGEKLQEKYSLIVESYKAEILFYNKNKVKIRIISKLSQILLNYFSQTLDINEIIELKEKKPMINKVTAFCSMFLDLDPLRLLEPLAEKTIEDQYHSIVMITPRSSGHSFFDPEESLKLLQEFEVFYEKIKERFFRPYLNRPYEEVEINDKYYVQMDNKIITAQLTMLGDELDTETIEYSDIGSNDRERIYAAKSFHDFLSHRSSRADYAFGTGNHALDIFISNSYPHLGI